MTVRINKQRHRKHANPFTIRGELPPPDWQQLYGRSAPFALDIGFGEGAFLWELAKRHPEWNVLGLEIRQHLVENALQGASALGLKNVHAVLANANVHLDALVPDASVAFVAVNFPDPWFKTRHKKRRVLTAELLDVLAKKMPPNAEFHAKSDYQPIAEQMFKTLSAHPAFVSSSPGFIAESTTGILTEREIKHTRRGEPIYRMLFYKR